MAGVNAILEALRRLVKIIYSLNFLKGAMWGMIWGSIFGVIKGDARSLDNIYIAHMIGGFVAPARWILIFWGRLGTLRQRTPRSSVTGILKMVALQYDSSKALL